MSASALSTVERSTLVRASRSKVWQAITNIAEFSKWFGVEAEGEFTPGAHVRMVSTHEGYKGIEFFVDVVTMEAPEIFSWRWHPGSKQDGDEIAKEPMTLVEFRLTEAEGGTLVTVVESGFDRLSLARRTRVIEENTKGWEFQLASLSSYAGQGT